MTTPTYSADFSAITNIGTMSDPCTDTIAFFDCDYSDRPLSAIDAYIENCKEINKLWVAFPTISPEFSRILLLGYISAIESFMRTILRAIINSDAKAKADSHTYTVPYGAVLYHHKSTIVEALFEGISFAGNEGIKKSLKKFLDISNIPNQVSDMLIEYEKICHLRHCCVHRFGKLGTQNGIALGLENHKGALEKPLNLGIDDLGNIATWLMSFAKAINNFLFFSILERSLSAKNDYRINWSWTYSKDRAKFKRIYDIFASKKDGSPSPSVETMYERFKLANKPRVNSR